VVETSLGGGQAVWASEWLGSALARSPIPRPANARPTNSQLAMASASKPERPASTKHPTQTHLPPPPHLRPLPSPSSLFPFAMFRTSLLRSAAPLGRRAASTSTEGAQKAASDAAAKAKAAAGPALDKAKAAAGPALAQANAIYGKATGAVGNALGGE